MKCIDCGGSHLEHHDGVLQCDPVTGALLPCPRCLEHGAITFDRSWNMWVWIDETLSRRLIRGLVDARMSILSIIQS